LGLCFLHLLTGYEPYEVLLQDVFCPPFLIKKLQAIWTPSSIEDQYYVVREAVESSVLNEPDMENDTRDAGYEGALLAHTLYRYLVLFSALQEDDVNIDSPAWTAIKHALTPTDGMAVDDGDQQNPRRIKRKQRRAGTAEVTARAACIRQYDIDRAQWSLRVGSHPVMKAVRERLKDLGKGAFKLLERLVHFDPSRRCTMFEALISPVFAPLVDTSLSSEQITALAANHGGSPPSRSLSSSPRNFMQRSPSSRGLQHGVAFMHYYKNVDDGGIDSLNVV
jgi:serine/threonine protein kinase